MSKRQPGGCHYLCTSDPGGTTHHRACEVSINFNKKHPEFKPPSAQEILNVLRKMSSEYRDGDMMFPDLHGYMIEAAAKILGSLDEQPDPDEC